MSGWYPCTKASTLPDSERRRTKPARDSRLEQRKRPDRLKRRHLVSCAAPDLRTATLETPYPQTPYPYLLTVVRGT